MALATVPRETIEDVGVSILQIPLDQIDILGNVRVSVEGIDGLAASIEAHGVLQPVKVRPDRGRWALVWGQRRLLACQQLGLATIPAIVVDDAKVGHELAIEQLIENVNREDLPPLDRARAMRLVVDAGVSQADLARELGLHASTVANDLRLLTLDEGVQTLVETGAITPSHAKAIASLPAKQQRALAERVVTSKLSSHDLEREIKWKQDQATQDEAKAKKTAKWIPKTIAALEAAAIPKTVLVQVSGGYYDMDIEAVRASIKKAGWKSTTEWLQTRPAKGLCDCTAIKIEVGGRKLEIVPVCSDSRHRDRDVNARHIESEAAEKLRREQLAQLRVLLAGELEEAGLSVPALRIIAYVLRRTAGGWQDWAQLTTDGNELRTAIVTAVTQEWSLRDAGIGEVLAQLTGGEPIGPASVEDLLAASVDVDVNDEEGVPA